MIVLYDTLTGNVERFVKKLPCEAHRISDGLVVDEDFVFITYTTGLGKIPDSSRYFLQSNNKHLIAVAVSGNKNFGTLFAACADEISKIHNIPILLKFELSGKPSDIKSFMKGLNEIEAHRIK